MKLKKCMVLSLTASMLLSACNSSNAVNESVVETTIAVEESELNTELTDEEKEIEITSSTVLFENNKVTFSSLKEKYNLNNEDLGYSPLYNVDEEAKFTFHFNSLVDPFQAVTVHTDRECGVNSMVYTMNMAYFTEDGGIDVIVDRYYTPTLNVKDRLDYDENLNTWGHAGKYYLSINYDMNADVPTKLEEPIVIPFTLKNDVEIPILNYEVSRDGDFILTWNEVEGVDGYRIYHSYRSDEDLKDTGLNRERGYIGVNLYLLKEVEAGVNKVNLSDILSGDTYSDDDYCYNQNNFNLEDYYITAVKDGKESNFGIEVKSYLYGSQLPYSCEVSIGQDFDELPETFPVKMKDNSILEMPVNFTLESDKYANIGEVTYKYEVLGTKLTGYIDYKVPESGEYPKEKKSTTKFDSMLYESKIDLSLLSDTSFPVINDGKETESDLTKLKTYNSNSRVVYNNDALYERTDLEAARIVTNGIYTRDPFSINVVDYSDRQNDLKEREKQLGDIFSADENVDINESESKESEEEDDRWWETMESSESLEESEPDSDIDEDVNNEITADNVIEKRIETDNDKKNDLDDIEISINEDYFVYADSIEEEYLALNLINQEERIRIDFLPNLMDGEVLLDTILKVYYQNPYFLGFKSLDLEEDSDGSIYVVPDYNYSKEEASKMQHEIYFEAINILNEIIKPNMTDDEKLNAIWLYLEENTKYNYEVLDIAKQNNYQDVPEEYDYVFNTYGILVKKLGVCQSYAYTLSLLLNMCDIDCIMLTGYSTNVPHAWNALLLNNEYYWMDATANYNSTYIPYFLYRSSSDFAESLAYNLDDGFLLNADIVDVYNEEDTYDWYYVNNQVAGDDDALIKAIVDGWQHSDKLTFAVRLEGDYQPELTDDLGMEVAKSLYDIGISEEEIMKFGWVISGDYLIIAKNLDEFLIMIQVNGEGE